MGGIGFVGSPLGLGGGDILPLIPLSKLLARSITLPPTRVTVGGEPCSLATAGWPGSLFGDVMPRGVGTGRGFFARGGADEEGATL